MLNIIRADLYRIFRGKGIYITIVLFLTIIIMQVLIGSNVNAGVDVQSFDTLKDLNSNESSAQTLSDFVHPPTGIEAPIQVMSSSSNLLYFLIPLMIFIVGADFSSGTAKNVLSVGFSRSKYYFSKLILSCIFCVLLFLLYVFLSILLATAFNGFGGEFNAEYVYDVVKIFLSQLWFLLSGVCVGNFFVFTFRRSSSFIGIDIAFLLIPPIILVALSFAFEWFRNLFDYEISSCISLLTGINVMSAEDIIRFLLVGTIYSAVSVIAGLIIFKKAEVK